MNSPEAFKVLTQQFADREINVLHFYVSIARCDETAAIHILQMPFLSDGGDYFDFYALDSLDRLAQSDLDGLQRVLSHPELLDGITDERTALVVLLALGQENPAAAAAIYALPWVEDGIAYTAPLQTMSFDLAFANHEHHPILDLADWARHANESFWEVLGKQWVMDGFTSSEYQVFLKLFDMGLRDDQATARLLRMPFVQTFDRPKSMLRITQILSDLSLEDRNGFRRLLSNPALDDGTTNDLEATVALLALEIRSPDAFSAMEALPWIQDGISSPEQDGVLAIREIALESDSVFRVLLSKSWMRDGLTPDESRVVYGFASMAGSSFAISDESAALRILDMPFMEKIDSLDATALESLTRLLWTSESREDYLQRALSHPSLRGGITDDWTNVVAVLGRVADMRPDLLDVLLDPERTLVEERLIALPLAGEVALSVIWLGEDSDVRASRTMEMLEHAVRHHEEFMSVPYPKNYAIALVADTGGPAGGGGPDSIITIIPDLYESGELMAHETAHTYWFTAPTWIREGAASFLESLSATARIGAPLPEPSDSCGQLDNIAKLMKLRASAREDLRQCDYILGEGMFLDLYRSLGDEAFRQGFANLNLGMRDGTLEDECADTDRSACYIRTAFATNATPEKARIAEEIINRRYYGASR